MTTPTPDPLAEQMKAALPESMAVTKIMGDGYPSTFLLDRDDVVEMLAPTVHAAVRAGQAEALREAAGDLEENIDWSDGRSGYGDNDGYEASARELRARANEIERRHR